MKKAILIGLCIFLLGCSIKIEECDNSTQHWNRTVWKGTYLNETISVPEEYLFESLPPNATKIDNITMEINNKFNVTLRRTNEVVMSYNRVCS